MTAQQRANNLALMWKKSQDDLQAEKLAHHLSVSSRDAEILRLTRRWDEMRDFVARRKNRCSLDTRYDAGWINAFETVQEEMRASEKSCG